MKLFFALVELHRQQRGTRIDRLQTADDQKAAKNSEIQAPSFKLQAE